jgi:serine/threonine-protein kinase RsbW
MESEKLNFNSISSNISIAEKLIDDVCLKYNVDEDNYGNILIAVTEAVNNAINHGNQQDPTKKVFMAVDYLSDRSLKFTITDEGKGFDYALLPDPTDPENIEKISGRGVFLMKNLADSIEFSNDGKTVEMRFRLG